jgi:hypothetical protein
MLIIYISTVLQLNNIIRLHLQLKCGDGWVEVVLATAFDVVTTIGTVAAVVVVLY